MGEILICLNFCNLAKEDVFMLMSLIEVRKLKPKWRQVLKEDGVYKDTMLSAFVGAKDGGITQFGIGLLDERTGKAEFWGSMLPQNLITAWRAMWLLECVKRVKPGMIYAAYCVARRNFSRSCDGHHLETLRGQIPEIESLRDELLEAKIPDGELDGMLKICNGSENGINISASELEYEWRMGTINCTEELKRTLAAIEEEKAWQARAEEASKRPLPGHQSFRKFCKDFGLRNLCDQPSGSYGADWRHCDMKKIDQELVYYGLLRERVREIYCTKNTPHSKDFGQIGHPVLVMRDGRYLALTQVKYDQLNEMQLLLQATPLSEGGYEEWMTLPQARAQAVKMVGITCGPYSSVSDADHARGYVGASSTRKTYQFRSRG